MPKKKRRVWTGRKTHTYQRPQHARNGVRGTEQPSEQTPRLERRHTRKHDKRAAENASHADALHQPPDDKDGRDGGEPAHGAADQEDRDRGYKHPLGVGQRVGAPKRQLRRCGSELLAGAVPCDVLGAVERAGDGRDGGGEDGLAYRDYEDCQEQ